VLPPDGDHCPPPDRYRPLTTISLVATIFGWDYLLDWAGYRFPRIQRLLRPAPLLLVKDGRIVRRHLRRELITEAELMSQLRLQGVDDVTQVQKAYLEGDGLAVHERAQHRHPYAIGPAASKPRAPIVRL
jgi:uncharacterized membrane protein YcaP (DUF421 family)